MLSPGATWYLVLSFIFDDKSFSYLHKFLLHNMTGTPGSLHGDARPGNYQTFRVRVEQFPHFWLISHTSHAVFTFHAFFPTKKHFFDTFSLQNTHCLLWMWFNCSHLTYFFLSWDVNPHWFKCPFSINHDCLTSSDLNSMAYISEAISMFNHSVTRCLDSIAESSPLVTGTDDSEQERNRQPASVCTPQCETILHQRLITDRDEKHKCMQYWMLIYWLMYMHYMASFKEYNIFIL